MTRIFTSSSTHTTVRIRAGHSRSEEGMHGALNGMHWDVRSSQIFDPSSSRFHVTLHSGLIFLKRMFQRIHHGMYCLFTFQDTSTLYAQSFSTTVLAFCLFVVSQHLYFIFINPKGECADKCSTYRLLTWGLSHLIVRATSVCLITLSWSLAAEHQLVKRLWRESWLNSSSLKSSAWHALLPCLKRPFNRLPHVLLWSKVDFVKMECKLSFAFWAAPTSSSFSSDQFLSSS